MINLVKSEWIKGRHSFVRKSFVIFPLLVTLMAIFLMGGALVQSGAYNWWYIMLLPITVSLICISLTESDKKMCFFNIAILPVPKGKVWIAKIETGVLYLVIGNGIVFAMTALSRFFFDSQYSILQGLIATLVLSITWAWQIPLGMFLSTKFGSVATFLLLLGTNIVCSTQDIAGGRLWFIAFGIPARLMAPILGMNPNGVLLESDSLLWNTNVIFPGIFITIILFIVMLFLTKIWFERRSA